MTALYKKSSKESFMRRQSLEGIINQSSMNSLLIVQKQPPHPTPDNIVSGAGNIETEGATERVPPNRAEQIGIVTYKDIEEFKRQIQFDLAKLQQALEENTKKQMKESARKQHKEINAINPVASLPLGEVDQLSQVIRGDARKNSQEPLIDRFVS